MQPTSCPSCKHTNPPGSNFCNVCGSALPSLQCPRCGSLNDVAVATHCQRCGGSLLAPGPAPAWTGPALPAAARPALGGPQEPAAPMQPVARDDTIAQLFAHSGRIAAPTDRSAVALHSCDQPPAQISEAAVEPARRRGGPVIVGTAVALAAAVTAGAFYLLPARRSDSPTPAAMAASTAPATAARPAAAPPAASVTPDATRDALARAEALLNDSPPAAGPVASAAAVPAAAPRPPTPAAPAVRPARLEASPVVEAAISRRDAEPSPPSAPAPPPPCTDAVAALGLCSR